MNVSRAARRMGLDAEGAEVDVGLAAVMDFVVDGVLDCGYAGVGPRAEGGVERRNQIRQIL